MRKNLKNKIFALLLVLSVFVSAVGTTSVTAAGAKFTGTGSNTEVTTRGGTTSVKYTYANEDDGIFRSIQSTYEWDPDLMEFDSISGDHFEIVTSGSDVANGKLEVGFRYYAGIRTNTPELTINFKNCFSDPSKASTATVTSGYKPNANGKLVVNYVSNSGNYTVATGEEDIDDAVVTLNLPVSVAITPKTASVVKGETQAFASTVTNDDGSGVTWSVNGTDSSISSAGVLTVGDNETATSLTVTATSVKDTSKKATATVTVVNKPGLSVSVTGDATEVFKGEASNVQFTATPTTTATAATNITYAVSGNNDAGTTVDANGLLTISAAETSDTITVTATATNSKTDPATATASASVSLVEIGVTVTPTTVILSRGATHTFGSDIMNDLNNDGVTWSVSGNSSATTTVDASGKVTVGADETATSFTVTATSVKDTTKSASATVNVAAVTIAINETSSVVMINEERQLTAVIGNDETGAGVVWSISGNTSSSTKISSDGKLIIGADEVVGTKITVTATSATDSSKTSTVVLEVMEDADETVDDLFNPDGTIKEDLTQEDIDKAEDIINKMPDGDKKDELKDKLEDAQNQLNKKEAEQAAEKAVSDLFNPDGTIKDSVTQEDIDKAKDMVSKLADGDKKKELEAKLEDAQKQLDDKKTDPSKPILPEVPTSKPSTKPGGSGTTSNPATGDTTNMALMLSMLGISILGIVVGVKRRKTYSK